MALVVELKKYQYQVVLFPHCSIFFIIIHFEPSCNDSAAPGWDPQPTLGTTVLSIYVVDNQLNI